MLKKPNGRSEATRNVFLWAQAEAISLSSCSVSRIHCVANQVMMVVTHCSTRRQVHVCVSLDNHDVLSPLHLWEIIIGWGKVRSIILTHQKESLIQSLSRVILHKENLCFPSHQRLFFYWSSSHPNAFITPFNKGTPPSKLLPSFFETLMKSCGSILSSQIIKVYAPECQH